MPYTHNQDVKIYYEIEGQGPPLVFAHGGTGNMNSWRTYGYVEHFTNQYTVILFDARGHGQSDKPHAVMAYNYRSLVDDVITVLDDLQIDKAHFWGYSLGGYIGFGLAKHYPQRIHSLIIGGASPYSDLRPTTDPPGPLLQIMRKGIQEGPDAVVQGIRDLFGEITPAYETRLRSLDYQAQAAFLEYWEYHLPGLEDVLPTMAMPCFIYIADGDDPDFAHTKEYMRQIPNASFLGLPGHTHVSANTQIDSIVPKAKDFLAKV